LQGMVTVAGNIHFFSFFLLNINSTFGDIIRI
jgi:hypothetical protein